MSLSTHSKFYYGFEIGSDNYAIDFDEGAAELHAILNVGSYTLTEIAAEIERALNEVGGQVYTVSVARATRVLTISAPGAFSVLIATGTRLGVGAYQTCGFMGAVDIGPATTAVGTAAGSVYSTQFILQSYVAFDDFVGAIDGAVKVAASGRVEVVTFGDEYFMKCNMRYITSRTMPAGCFIRNAATGHQDARDFMNHARKKRPIEFMADEDAPNTYDRCILESTPDNKDGLLFELKELVAENLPLFYETGVLKFRRQD